MGRKRWKICTICGYEWYGYGKRCPITEVKMEIQTTEITEEMRERKRRIEKQYDSGEICGSTYRGKKKHFTQKYGVNYDDIDA